MGFDDLNGTLRANEIPIATCDQQIQTELQSELFILEEENTMLQQQCDRFETALQEHQTRAAAMAKDISYLENERNNLSDKLSKLSKMVSQLEHQLQLEKDKAGQMETQGEEEKIQMQHELAILRHKLSAESTANKTLIECVAEYTTKITTLEDQILLLSDNRQMQNSLHEKEQLQSELEFTRQQLQDVERTTDQLKNELKELEEATSELKVTKDNLTKSERAREILSKQLQELKAENAELQHELLDLKTQLRLVKYEDKNKTQGNESLNAENIADSSITNLTEELKQLTLENDELQQNLKQYQESYSALYNQLTKAQEEMISFANQQL